MYPVQFRRISSNFSRSRLHPVLGVSRPHLGTDFAADVGTPIEATGDGTVIRAGRWGGLGIMVGLRHAKGIETRYGHMSRIAAGIRPGVRVRQGDVIGYVGMTGLTNGPHVHYEFLKNGRHLNPRRVDLGDGEPVPAAQRPAFDSARVAFDRLLGRPPRVAKVN
jgi:murein DD-endopeptidase MepM/ murein hydrolase activator NlpD